MSTCDGTRNIRADPRRNQRHERHTKTVVTSPLQKYWPRKSNTIYTLEGLPLWPCGRQGRGEPHERPMARSTPPRHAPPTADQHVACLGIAPAICGWGCVGHPTWVALLGVVGCWATSRSHRRASLCRELYATPSPCQLL